EDFAAAEREHPDAGLAFWPALAVEDAQAGAQRTIARHLDPALVRQLTLEHWQGTANRLSRDASVRWEVIDAVAAATRKPRTEAPALATLDDPVLAHSGHASSDGPTAGQIILQRRSLQACDATTSISAECF